MKKNILFLFTDKNNSPFSLSNPQAFLTQKAIDRRTKQHITYQQNDIPVNPAYIDSVKKIGVNILLRSRWFNTITTDTIDSIALNKIMAFPFVKKNHAVAIIANNPTSVEQKLNYNTQQRVASTTSNQRINSYNYGTSYNQIHMLNGDILHNNGYRGNGMTIAILDAGFNKANVLPAFDSLWANNQILGTHDFVTGGTSVFEDDSHGMEVLSCMGGNWPGQLIGTAPKASYWLLRSEEAAHENIVEEANWVSAAEFADSVGADIINSSLGYTTFDNESFFHNSHKYADMNGKTALATIGADIAASKGILIVNSAGNSGGDSWHYIGVPADGDSVLAIGAVYNNGIVTTFSSRGPSADGRIKPNVSAQGGNCTLQDTNGGITYNSGTSFSSPITAGMCACLWQANPTFTNMEIFHAVERSASVYNNPNDSIGYGIPDFVKALSLLSGIELYSPIKMETLSAYPNPSSNSLNLTYDLSDTSQNIKIELFDIFGKQVYVDSRQVSMGSYTQKIDISYLTPGVYYAKLSTAKSTISIKVIKY
jgi:serine protease AprX